LNKLTDECQIHRNVLQQLYPECHAICQGSCANIAPSENRFVSIELHHTCKHRLEPVILFLKKDMPVNK